MTIMNSDSNKVFYCKLIRFLNDCKIVYGPAEVSRILRRHKGLAKFIYDELSLQARTLESELTILE